MMFGERDRQIFSLFEEAAANVAAGAGLLLEITADPTTKENKVPELEQMEHRGDELTHDIIAELNRAFITLIDREDIFLIAKEMDNVIDVIEATGHRFVMLGINETTPMAQKLAQLIVQSTGELVTIMNDLGKLKRIATNNQTVVEINRIEDEGDKIYRSVVRELYSGSYDVLYAIRGARYTTTWKTPPWTRSRTWRTSSRVWR